MIQQGFLMNGDCLSFIDHHEGNCTEVIRVEKVEYTIGSKKQEIYMSYLSTTVNSIRKEKNAESFRDLTYSFWLSVSLDMNHKWISKNSRNQNFKWLEDQEGLRD